MPKFKGSKGPEKRYKEHGNRKYDDGKDSPDLDEIHKSVSARSINKDACRFERRDERERRSVSYCNDEGSGI